MGSLRVSDENLERFRTLSDDRKTDRFMTMLLDTYEEKLRNMRTIELEDEAYDRIAEFRQDDETVDECFERLVKQYAKEMKHNV